MKKSCGNVELLLAVVVRVKTVIAVEEARCAVKGRPRRRAGRMVAATGSSIDGLALMSKF